VERRDAESVPREASSTKSKVKRGEVPDKEDEADRRMDRRSIVELLDPCDWV